MYMKQEPQWKLRAHKSSISMDISLASEADSGFKLDGSKL